MCDKNIMLVWESVYSLSVHLYHYISIQSQYKK